MTKTGAAESTHEPEMLRRAGERPMVLSSGGDLSTALDMTRHDEQREIADFLAQVLEDAGELDFLACMRAGGEEDGLCGCDAGLGQHIAKLVDLRSRDAGTFGIVFDAAGEVDAVAFDAKAFPAGDVVLFLHENLFQHAEDRADETAKLAVATFTARGEACVDETRRECRGVRLRRSDWATPLPRRARVAWAGCAPA
jgi:hypothetical protein